MRINVNELEGNIYSILGVAKRLLREAGAEHLAHEVTKAVLDAESFHDACLAVHKATGGAITFWDDDTQLEFEEGE